jgi:CBS domain-containing protein
MADEDPLTADFAAKFPDSFARVLGRADTDDIVTVLDKLPATLRASIAARLAVTHLSGLLDAEGVAPETWLLDASFDDAVMLLSRLPRERRLPMVNSLGNRSLRQRLLRHLQFPTHSVGALVGDIRLHISLHANVEDVVDELRDAAGDEPEPVVVVDSDGRYVGMLHLWRVLVSAHAVGRIQDYVQEVAPLHPEIAISDALHNEGWLRHNWLPVVDHRQRVLGSVSRAKLFQATSDSPARHHGSAHVFVKVVAEAVYVLGALFSRLIVRGNAR